MTEHRALTIAEQEALQRFKAEIESLLADNLVSLCLFGSRARGEGTEESDLDVLAADPRLSKILTPPVALQLRWQYLQRIRGDYRTRETISLMTAQTDVSLAEQILANVEGYLHAQHP